MNLLSIEEWELLGYFESDPDRQGLDDLWNFDSSAYSVERNEIKLILAICPHHKDVRITLKSRGCVVYDHDRMSVEDIRLVKETLTIIINEKEKIDILIKPEIKIIHVVQP